MMLQTDRYYRGYRLSTQPTGEVVIYRDAERITQEDDLFDAIRTIDIWLNAR